MNKQIEALKLALEALEESHPEAYRNVITAIREALAEQPAQQPNEADELIRNLGFDPERFRTEAGFINHMKLRAAIKHPEEYQAAMQPMYQTLTNCVLCGRLNPKEGVCDHGIEQPAQQQEPVACPFPCGWKNLFSIIVSDGAFLAQSLVEDEPITGHQRASVMRLIDYAKTMALHWINTSPPASKPWVGLTKTEKKTVLQKTAESIDAYHIVMTHWPLVADAIEAKLREKNSP